ncbi:hypothetical protein OG937_45500 [Streptomyces sp. NBC_00510]
MRHIGTTIAACLLAAALTACGIGSSTTTEASAPSPSAATSAPTKAEKLNAWFDDGGQDHLDTISDDLDDVISHMGATDLDELAESCAKLTSDVETIQGGQPMPDAKAASSWGLALEHLNSAATHCTNGAVSMDVDEINQMTAELKIGTNHVDAMNERLDMIRNGN